MWPNLQETANLVTFTEEIFNRKLHFVCSATVVGNDFVDFYISVLKLLTLTWNLLPSETSF